MINSIKLVFAVLIFNLVCFPSQAQDPTFSQFYANPLYLNPAFAGTTYNPKFHLNFRDQWPAFSHAYISYSASYDQYFEALHGGVGAVFLGDQAGEGIYKTFSASLIYAYQLNISPSFAIKAGAQGTFVQKQIDLNKVFFYDQIDPISGFNDPGNNPNPTNETTILAPTVRYADISVGALAYSEKFFGGFAAKHINQPIESFSDNLDNELPIRYTGHVGAVLGGNNKNSFTFSPNAMYSRQGQFQQLNVGSYLKHGIIFGGLWFRHNITDADAVIMLAGIHYGVFRFGYSYDITVSDLAGHSGGAHEVSIIINLDDMEGADVQRNKGLELRCPQMF